MEDKSLRKDTVDYRDHYSYNVSGNHRHPFWQQELRHRSSVCSGLDGSSTADDPTLGNRPSPTYAANGWLRPAGALTFFTLLQRTKPKNPNANSAMKTNRRSLLVQSLAGILGIPALARSGESKEALVVPSRSEQAAACRSTVDEYEYYEPGQTSPCHKPGMLIRSESTYDECGRLVSQTYTYS